jgi:hypothetical protein
MREGLQFVESIFKKNLNEDDEWWDDSELKQHKGQYVIVVSRTAKTRFSGTLLNPYGGSSGMGQYPNKDGAIKAVSRLSGDAINHIQANQGGEIPVYFRDWDFAAGEPMKLKPMNPVKV